MNISSFGLNLKGREKKCLWVIFFNCENKDARCEINKTEVLCGKTLSLDSKIHNRKQQMQYCLTKIKNWFDKLLYKL